MLVWKIHKTQEDYFWSISDSFLISCVNNNLFHFTSSMVPTAGYPPQWDQGWRQKTAGGQHYHWAGKFSLLCPKYCPAILLACGQLSSPWQDLNTDSQAPGWWILFPLHTHSWTQWHVAEQTEVNLTDRTEVTRSTVAPSICDSVSEHHNLTRQKWLWEPVSGKARTVLIQAPGWNPVGGAQS